MNLDIDFIIKAKNVPLFVAFCIEYKNCILSENPNEFMSAMPIVVDCTCNGLQHLAAMISDVIIAKGVNLLSADTIQDIYSTVAQKVTKDCNLNFTVSRSMVKKIVMTVPYNCSMYSAAEYFISQFRYNPECNMYYPDDNPSVLITYKELYRLSSVVYKTFFKMHPSLKIVVEYFRDMADMMTACGCAIV